jgi:hypothetical protein
MDVVGLMGTINRTGGQGLCRLTYLVLASMLILRSAMILGEACDSLNQLQKLLANDPDSIGNPTIRTSWRLPITNEILEILCADTVQNRQTSDIEFFLLRVLA